MTNTLKLSARYINRTPHSIITWFKLKYFLFPINHKYNPIRKTIITLAWSVLWLSIITITSFAIKEQYQLMIAKEEVKQARNIAQGFADELDAGHAKLSYILQDEMAKGILICSNGSKELNTRKKSATTPKGD